VSRCSTNLGRNGINTSRDYRQREFAQAPGSSCNSAARSDWVRTAVSAQEKARPTKQIWTAGALAGLVETADGAEAEAPMPARAPAVQTRIDAQSTNAY